MGGSGEIKFSTPRVFGNRDVSGAISCNLGSLDLTDTSSVVERLKGIELSLQTTDNNLLSGAQHRIKVDLLQYRNLIIPEGLTPVSNAILNGQKHSSKKSAITYSLARSATPWIDGLNKSTKCPVKMVQQLLDPRMYSFRTSLELAAPIPGLTGLSGALTGDVSYVKSETFINRTIDLSDRVVELSGLGLLDNFAQLAISPLQNATKSFLSSNHALNSVFDIKTQPGSGSGWSLSGFLSGGGLLKTNLSLYPSDSSDSSSIHDRFFLGGNGGVQARTVPGFQPRRIGVSMKRDMENAVLNASPTITPVVSPGDSEISSNANSSAFVHGSGLDAARKAVEEAANKKKNRRYTSSSSSAALSSDDLFDALGSNFYSSMQGSINRKLIVADKVPVNISFFAHCTAVSDNPSHVFTHPPFMPYPYLWQLAKDMYMAPGVASLAPNRRTGAWRSAVGIKFAIPFDPSLDLELCFTKPLTKGLNDTVSKVQIGLKYSGI